MIKIVHLKVHSSNIPYNYALPVRTWRGEHCLVQFSEQRNKQLQYAISGQLRPPKVSRNWGKQRLVYQAITDCLE